jgi:hypothetical protein
MTGLMSAMALIAGGIYLWVLPAAKAGADHS